MKRNKFSLSHFTLKTGSMGSLIPLTWNEVLPGDTWQQSTSVMVRCSPLATPVMHPVHVRVHHFFVPYRVIWQGTQTRGSPIADSGFESFITGGPDGLDATVHPYITMSANAGINTLADQLGLPTQGMTTNQINVSALPFRAYSFIWNEFFRDQDIQTALVVNGGDGLDTTTNQTIQNVTWMKDYFTTARPWESKGPAVGVFPTGAAAPIEGLGIVDGTTASNSPAGFRDSDGQTGVKPGVQTTTAGVWVQTLNTGATGAGNPPRIFADLGQQAFIGGDINALRRQFALQRFQEARASYGSRYTEYLRYLGIRSSDARLQRPEYLGGGTSTIQFSEVLQTAGTSNGTGGVGVGIMSGHGISAHRTNRFRRFFEEHGMVMTLFSVRPISMYTQPIARKWLRGMTNAGGSQLPAGLLGTREDYFQRELQNIGKEQINNVEVDAQGGATGAWGFQDRYDSYRRVENSVTGQFRNPGIYTTWHFARSFGSPPALNATFLNSVPTLAPFQDQSHDQLLIMANHSIQVRRMMTKNAGVGFVR